MTVDFFPQCLCYLCSSSLQLKIVFPLYFILSSLDIIFKGCLYHGKFFFLSLSIIVDDFAESVILGCFTLFGLECFVQVPQSFH